MIPAVPPHHNDPPHRGVTPPHPHCPFTPTRPHRGVIPRPSQHTDLAARGHNLPRPVPRAPPAPPAAGNGPVPVSRARSSFPVRRHRCAVGETGRVCVHPPPSGPGAVAMAIRYPMAVGLNKGYKVTKNVSKPRQCRRRGVSMRLCWRAGPRARLWRGPIEPAAPDAQRGCVRMSDVEPPIASDPVPRGCGSALSLRGDGKTQTPLAARDCGASGAR